MEVTPFLDFLLNPWATVVADESAFTNVDKTTRGSNCIAFVHVVNK